MELQELMSKYKDKEPNYFFTKKFIQEGYQQDLINTENGDKYKRKYNGYIYNAREAIKKGNKEIKINYREAEPNQKWHFFDSYIKGNNIDVTQSAKKVYNRLLCPELLLWIIEAAGINKESVQKVYKKAKEIIDIDRTNGYLRNKAGREIRKNITWEMIQEHLNQSNR